MEKRDTKGADAPAARSGFTHGTAGAVVVLGLTLAWLLYRQPRWVVRGLSRLEPDVLWFVDTPEPLVALTIDDGPSRDGTPRILDALSDHDARATFFMLSDHLAGNEDLVRRLAAEGHEVANHLTADWPSIRLSPSDFKRDLLKADTALRPYGAPRWFRPGSGLFSRRMIGTARRCGYRVALASVYPFDASIPSVSYAVHKMVTHAEPGSVILLHDGSSRGPRTATVLERALPALQARGLKVVTLTELQRASSGLPGKDEASPPSLA